jgi:hypothetical protein
MPTSYSWARSAAAIALACSLATCKDTTEPEGKPLQISFSGAGSGLVALDPAPNTGGASCATPTTTSCTVFYTDMEQEVTLTATASAGSGFAGWSGDCNGTGTCVVTMNNSHNVTANFVVGNVLTLTITGGGGGQVNLSPAGEPGGTCQSPATLSCTALYTTSNQVVTITATSQGNNVFSGWGGDCTGMGACSVTMSQARAVTATFSAGHTLGISIFGNGSVTLSPPTEAGGGHDCGNPTVVSCTAFYSSSSQQVVLTAAAPPNFTFERWTGSCAPGGGAGQCIVTMNQNTGASATFNPSAGGFSVTITITGNGSVSMSPSGNAVAGANCSNPTTTQCTAIYTTNGQQVTLTAAPSGSGNFLGWSGNSCSGSSQCVLTMTGPHNATARFSP